MNATFGRLFTGLMIAAAAFTSTQVAASSVRYETTWTALTGPSWSPSPDGTGSFIWNADTGSITDFKWDFLSGSVVGGMSDYYDSTVGASGGTFGQYAFEILTGLDVHPLECSGVTNACEAGGSVRSGTAPSGASALLLYRNQNGAFYDFVGGAVTGGLVDPHPHGRITVMAIQSPVPEPEALALLIAGVGILTLFTRRRAGQQFA